MDEFIQKAMIKPEHYDLFKLYYSIYTVYFYHFIVNKSAFKSFLRKVNRNTIIPYKASEHGNHVHFLLISQYPFEGVKHISRSFEIERYPFLHFRKRS